VEIVLSYEGLLGSSASHGTQLSRKLGTHDTPDPKALSYDRTSSTKSNAKDERLEFAPFQDIMSPDALIGICSVSPTCGAKLHTNEWV
jgi:hypothetical protein